MSVLVYGRCVAELESQLFGSSFLQEARQRTCCFTLLQWGAYWSIPKVKFAFHAIMQLAIFAALALMLIVPRKKPYDEFDRVDGLEMFFWVGYFGRVREECGQLMSQGLREYFLHTWNRIDAALFVANTIALILRAMTLFIVFNDFPCRSYQITDESCLLDLNYTVSETVGLRNAVAQATNTLALGRDFQVIGMMLLLIRYLEILTYSKNMGETVMVFIEMVADSRFVIYLMLFWMGLTGIAMESAFVGLDNRALDEFARGARAVTEQACQREGSLTDQSCQMPATIDLAEDPEVWGWFRPALFGLWASLGETETALGNIHEKEQHREERLMSLGLSRSSVPWISFNIWPFWLYLATFVITVFLGE